MTVRDLIDELSKYPDYMRVVTATRSGRMLWADQVQPQKPESENVVAIVVVSSKELTGAA